MRVLIIFSFVVLDLIAQLTGHGSQFTVSFFRCLLFAVFVRFVLCVSLRFGPGRLSI